MRLSRVRFRVRELMGVVAVAGVLTAGVLSLQRVSEAGYRETCRNNLASLALGLASYATEHQAFPRGTVANDRLPPEKRLSWFTVAWAYVEQLFWLLDPSEAWDSGANRVTRCRGVEGAPHAVGRIANLACPAAPGSSDEHMPGWTWYVGIAGVGRDAPGLPPGHPRAGVFGYDRETPLSALKDGAASTLLIAETGAAIGPWTAGGPATVRGLDTGARPYVGRGRQFGGLHRGGVMVVFADGSVRFLGESIDPKVFEALSTVAGGESLPDGWDR